MKHAERIAVLGAGTMGQGIAHVAAGAGFPTTLFDTHPEALARAEEGIAANLQRGVERGKITSEERAHALGCLETQEKLATAVTDAAWVIEAVPENLELKKEVFAQLGTLAPPNTLLATNTSSLSITEIAAASTRAAQVVGLHFFNPPHIMKLVEIVEAEQTSAETLERAQTLAQRLRREVVVVKDTPGFATSRLGVVLGLEAMRMLEQGVASAPDIDRALELGYRHPMGPLRLTDLVGLDVRLAIADHLHRELGGDQFQAPVILRRMVRAGKLGQKTGEGFYRW